MMAVVDQTTKERMTAVATDPSGAAAPPVAALSAEPAERLERTRAPSSLSGVNRWIALGAALVLHLTILAPLWLDFEWRPSAAPPSEEIPVEIIVEQPKPPPPPQPPEAAPPKPPIDLEPAHDAPRGEASDVKTPRYGAEAAKSAEKQAPPDQPQAGDKAASSDAAKPAEPTSDHQAAAKDDGGPLMASDEASAAAEPPATIAAPDSRSKVATMIGQPLPTWSKGKEFSTFEPVPDAQFAGDAASPVGGGTANTTYTSVIDGMLKKHLRMTDAVRAEYERVVGEITFGVDPHGNLLQPSVTRPSGSNSVDAAALEAVREAAPFPPSPFGVPIGLTWVYGGKAGG
jgi:protein TonB